MRNVVGNHETFLTPLRQVVDHSNLEFMDRFWIGSEISENN